MKIIEEQTPWRYGIYSSSLVRFDEKCAEILRRDTLTWQEVRSLALYRRLIEEADLLSTKEALKLLKAMREKKPTCLD